MRKNMVNKTRLVQIQNNNNFEHRMLQATVSYFTQSSHYSEQYETKQCFVLPLFRL